MENVKKTSLGMDENIEAALSYFLGFLTGILFFLLEKESKFVKFHAMQSIAVFIALFVINMVLGIILTITIVGLFLFPLIYLIEVILWIFLMYKAYKGEKFKLPIVGDFAEKQVAQ
jgi:uncharacterized membrane protein